MARTSVESYYDRKNRLDLYTGPTAATRGGWLDNFFQEFDGENTQTLAHSKNVAFYAAALAELADFDLDTTKLTYISALLHDRGKFPLVYDYSRHATKGSEWICSSQFLNQHYDQYERSVIAFITRYHHGSRAELNGSTPLQNIRSLCANKDTRDAYPHIEDWDKLYDMMMVIMMADQFASMTDPKSKDETARSNGYRRHTFYEAFLNMISQFEGFCEKEETQLKYEKVPKLEKFDRKFYKVFLKFGDFITRYEEQNNFTESFLPSAQ